MLRADRINEYCRRGKKIGRAEALPKLKALA
jgi:hypothetical protein